jgi:hypothetical protein
MPKSAGALGDKITITNWQPRIRNTMRGFFSATLPSGMILHRLMLHERGESRWVGLPGREWVNERGGKEFANLIEFRDRATGDRFRAALLQALDRYLEHSE